MRIASLVLFLLSSVAAFAHSDLEKPLYVSLNGADTGNCQDVSQPCSTIAYALSNAG